MGLLDTVWQLRSQSFARNQVVINNAASEDAGVVLLNLSSVYQEVPLCVPL